jgi:hypothetical protein
MGHSPGQIFECGEAGGGRDEVGPVSVVEEGQGAVEDFGFEAREEG